MTWFKKSKLTEPADAFKSGDKVYISAMVSVYEAEVIAKDQGRDGLSGYATKYIVKVMRSGELLTVREDSLTPIPTNVTSESEKE